MVKGSSQDLVRGALAVGALTLSTNGCILFYDEVVDPASSGASAAQSASASGTGGQGQGSGDAGSSGVGGAGGAGCVAPPDLGVITQEMNCPGGPVAATPTGVFVVRDDCTSQGPGYPTVIRFDGDLSRPSGAVGVLNAFGLGLVARSETLVLYAAQTAEIASCNVGDFSCASISSNCTDASVMCDKPWGGLVRLADDSFVGIQNKDTPYVFGFDANGAVFSNLTASNVISEIGYEVDGVGSASNYTLGWTTRAADGMGGTIARKSTSVQFAGATAKLGPPSGIALAADGTIFVRAGAAVGDATSKVYVWAPAAPEPTPYVVDIIGPTLGKIALHRPTATFYANGFKDGVSGSQTVFRCACGNCEPASIDCGVIGDIDVDRSSGRAYFTCDTRIVKF